MLSVEDDPKDVEDSGLIIWNYYKVDGAQSKQGGAKYIKCLFCETSLTVCSSSWALAHVLVELFLLKIKQMLELVYNTLEGWESIDRF